MSRANRVRDLSTWQLELEASRATEDVLLEALLGDEREFTKAERRLRRVMRELARRDYMHRPHGKRCTCSDCLYLLDVWRTLQRRSPVTHGDDSP